MTCEDRVGIRLYKWFEARSQAKIVSFHPPAAKAYNTDLIRIPRRVNGVRTNERYHVDLIIVEEGVLFLIELKCRLSEGRDDTTKLREILLSYSLDELLLFINTRLTVPISLDGVNSVALCLGFEVLDSLTGPDDFILFHTPNEDLGLTKVVVGAAVPSHIGLLFNSPLEEK